MGERQYQLLLECPECPCNVLATAWRNWNDLLGYKNSEWQRQNLVFGMASRWGEQWHTYREIQRGLYGTIDENTVFLRDWAAIGFAECQEYRERACKKEWTMFKSVRVLLKPCERGMREIWQALYPQIDEDQALGRKLD
jgi:hypothetical protein